MALATISEIEKKVGLDTYAVENEGIGGIIKVKVSELADYCDMVRDGVQIEDNQPFKEKVV